MEKPELVAPQPARPERERNERRERERDRGRYEPVAEPENEEDLNNLPTAMEIALREAMGDDVISSVKAKERGSKKKQRRKQRGQYREEQEELLSRTLQLQGNE
jgi:hypothetical protein